ncbi:MAG: acyltransferase family protein [Paludibacter sp.]
MTERNTILDFVKGCCVLGMIFHHSYGYFYSRSDVLHYLFFVTGSFLFITGFILTKYYPAKYNLSKDYQRICGRLLGRGLKLLVLFAVLNIIISVCIKKAPRPGIMDISGLLHLYFISGNYQTIAFEMLAPISYTIILMALFFYIFKEKAFAVVPVSIMLFIIASFISYDLRGEYNFRYMTLGLAGAAFGLIPHTYIEKYMSLFLSITGMFLGVTVFTAFFKYTYPTVLVVVVIYLSFFYALGIKAEQFKAFFEPVTLLGVYSLASYLFQIAFLQALRVLIRPIDESHLSTVVIIFVTIIGTYGFIAVLHRLRVYRFIDAAYRYVFV